MNTGSEQIELTAGSAGERIVQQDLDEAIADAALGDTWERDLLALAERCAQESGVARGSDYARVIDALDTIRAEGATSLYSRTERSP